jgi:tetratricopeptide (TPR) repeat protein
MMPSEILQDGVRALQSGQPNRALDLMRDLLAIDPLNAAARHLQAIAQIGLSQADFGIAGLRRSLALNPKNSLAWVHLGVQIRDTAARGHAIAAYQRALALQPGDAYALTSLGNALAKQRRHDDAAAAFTQALGSMPYDNDLYHALISALANSGDRARALIRAREALLIAPGQARATEDLAILMELLSAPNLGSVMAWFAVSVPPTNTDLRCRIARLLAHNGKPTSAIARLRETATALPDDGRAYREIGAIHLERKRYVEGHTALIRAVVVDDANDVTLETLVWALVTADQPLAAQDLVDQVTRQRALPSSMLGPLNLILAGDDAGAEPVELSSEHTSLLTLFGQSFYRTGHSAVSRLILNRARHANTDAATPTAALLRNLIHAGDITEAEELLATLPQSLRQAPEVRRQTAELEINLLHRETDRYFRSNNGDQPEPPGLPDLPRIAAQDILQSLSKALDTAPLQTAPSHHVLPQALFDEATYRTLIENMPETSKLNWHGNPGYPDRSVHPLSWDGCHAIWPTLREVFNHPVLIDFTVRALGAENLRRFIEERGFELYGSSNLTIDRKQYSLGPHRDHVTRFASALLYLPRAEIPESMGTSLYRPRFKTPRSDNGRHQAFSEFDLVTTAPFKANTGLFFLNYGDAYHGVEPIRDDVLRAVLQYTIYIRRAGD